MYIIVTMNNQRISGRETETVYADEWLAKGNMVKFTNNGKFIKAFSIYNIISIEKG